MKKRETTEKFNYGNVNKSGMKRRSFVKMLGGGIFVFFQPWNVLDIFGAVPPQRRSLTKDYNAFLQVAEDGTITCFT